MFVLKSTLNRETEALTESVRYYKNEAENTKTKLNQLYSDYQTIRAEVNNLRADRTQYRQALHAIVKQETPGRNATVGRMVRFAQAALKGSFGKKTLDAETTLTEGVRE